MALRVSVLSALVAVGLVGSAPAGHRNFAANGFAIGAGVYVGPTANGGYGPVYGLYPIYYPGFYGNGFSAYGPPVPTYGAIPGVFGGYDQVYNRYPPMIGGTTGRFARRASQGVNQPPAPQPELESVPAPVGPLPAPARPQPAPGEELPPPAPVVTAPGSAAPVSTPVSTTPVATTAEPPLADGPSFRIQVHVPDSARVFIDGRGTTQTGEVRGYASPALNADEVYSYAVRAEWDEAGRKHTETRTVTGKPGSKPYVIDFLSEER